MSGGTCRALIFISNVGIVNTVTLRVELKLKPAQIRVKGI